MNSATSSMGSCNCSCAAAERRAGEGRGSGLADAVAVFCGAENRALAFFWFRSARDFAAQEEERGRQSRRHMQGKCPVLLGEGEEGLKKGGLF